MTLAELKAKEEVAVVATDHQGLIQFVNQKFTDDFGWSQAEVNGQSLSLIIPPRLHEAHHLGFSRFLVTENPTILNRPLTLKAQTKDGREIDVEHYIIAEKREGQWSFGATLKIV